MSQEEKSLILMVDDNPENLKVLGSQLGEHGYRLAGAESGKAALEFVQKKKPDLILLDMMMPGMNGLETCERLKDDEKSGDIPVLFLTAVTDDYNKAKAFEAGAVDYILKPFSKNEVLARVKVHLELRRVIGELENANRDLHESNELKRRFLGMAAHDLRNPLISIRGYSELLLSDDAGTLKERQPEFLDIIFQVSQQMLDLINDLLDVSVIESGKLVLNLRDDSLKRLVEERLRIHEVQAWKKEIDLCAELEEIPLQKFDPNRMGQVLDNLISNAIKFSSPGSPVEIVLRSAGMGTEVCVRDKGPGLSKEDQARLFGEFQRLGAQPTAGERGTGLGLAIAKKIVEAHKGSIEVTSELGEGTTVCVYLPLSVVSPSK